MPKTSKVAQLLGTGQDSARQFCVQVQNQFPGEKPSFDAIAAFLETHPHIAKNASSVGQAMLDESQRPKLATAQSAVQHVEEHRPVEILDSTNNLATLLDSVRSSTVDVVVGFASKTDRVIEALLRHANHVALTVGTINHFTDPAFIKACRQMAATSPRFEFSVDFRGEDSIHWKVYLIGPDTVIVGSPNFTGTGLSMLRDTAVRIQDRVLYDAYCQQIAQLRAHEQVVQHNDARFDDLLAEYERHHRKVFTRSFSPVTAVASAPSHAAPDFAAWAAGDRAQILPLYIWERRITNEERRTFNEKVKPAIVGHEAESPFDEIHIVGMYKAPKDQPYYHSGDLVLCLETSGESLEFDMVDIVVYGVGKWWLCRLASTDIPTPFALTAEFKKAISTHLRTQDISSKAYLDSNDFRAIVSLMQHSKSSIH